MAMFLVVLHRSGPEWDRSKPMEGQSGWPEHATFMDELEADGFIVLGGPLDDVRVAHAIEAESKDEVRATWARDPWFDSHLRLVSIEPWTIRLDGRRPWAYNDGVEDPRIHSAIEDLVAEEHELWRRESQGEATDRDRERLRDLKVSLDQCWDLLRQRRALREAGLDPRTAEVRRTETVEGYEQ